MEIQKNKSKEVLTIVILVILVMVLGGYIIYDKFLSNEKVITTEESGKKTTSTEQEIENDESNDYKALFIDSSNCLTDCNNIEYKLASSVAGDGVEVLIANNENTKINVNINRRLLKNEYAYEFSSNEDMYTFEFTKKIQDLFVGHIGQDSSIPMLFILLEDGSVQYIDLYSKITTGNSNLIELSGVKNVIKFYSASARSKGNEVGGIMTVLAQTFDGKFYDLNDIIFKQ